MREGTWRWLDSPPPRSLPQGRRTYDTRIMIPIRVLYAGVRCYTYVYVRDGPREEFYTLLYRVGRWCTLVL